MELLAAMGLVLCVIVVLSVFVLAQTTMGQCPQCLRIMRKSTGCIPCIVIAAQQASQQRHPSVCVTEPIPLYDQAALSENLIEWSHASYDYATEHHCARQAKHGIHLHQQGEQLVRCDGRDLTRST